MYKHIMDYTPREWFLSGVCEGIGRAGTISFIPAGLIWIWFIPGALSIFIGSLFLLTWPFAALGWRYWRGHNKRMRQEAQVYLDSFISSTYGSK